MQRCSWRKSRDFQGRTILRCLERIYESTLSDRKMEKDLLYIYYILRYCPDAEMLVAEIEGFSGTDYFEMFRKNIRKYIVRSEDGKGSALHLLHSEILSGCRDARGGNRGIFRDGLF